MLRSVSRILRFNYGQMLAVPSINLVNINSKDTPNIAYNVSLKAMLSTSQVALKYERKSNKATEDLDSDDELDAEFKDERDSKVIKTNVNSLRADLLLKSGLGMARNKVELNFYESKIRVNGKKLQKKSVQLQVGDEIDVIRGFSQTNPSHLVVARVVILSAGEREDGLNVHLRRYKSMLIENYAGANSYKSSEHTVH
ncbi:CG4884 [Drosophila busckii]|uniref:CG4884 n=1 Tax=Drosophila busckii TaxID=30019 RepID=A0A0M3QYG1_DROBS|nr:mitochondrial transcription rescue factor 1 [Drosophila busckii]ALC47559.1 CG4884 [Drosophila busckii]